MILYTVFLMFVDLFKKPVSGGVSRLAQKEKVSCCVHKNTSLELYWNFIRTTFELH